MKKAVVIFEEVTKSYPLYTHLTSGFKSFILNFREALNNTKKKFIALKEISFEIYQGECFGIIGKNGVGKSTLLGLIAGILKPDKGKITVNGKVASLLELGAGFHPELTGRENIILNGIILGMTKKEIMQKIDEIIAFSELEEFIDQPVKTYSSGMLARLGFSVIAHLEFEILLVDEILAVGDLSFQKKCREKFQEFKRKEATIILVTHNLQEILSLCDRTMWLENHQIKMLGNPEEVVQSFQAFSKL